MLTATAMATASQSSSSLTSLSSSFIHDHKTSFVKSFSKPSQRASLLSPNPGWSFTVKASASIATVSTATTAIINGNAKVGHFCGEGDLSKAVELLCYFRSQKSDLDVKTYCSVLELCAQRRSLKDGKIVHSLISDSRLEIDGYLGEKIVFMYVNCGDLTEARRVFDQISSDRPFVWNMLMSEYAKIRKFREGVGLFVKMLKSSVRPNAHTFSCLLKCLASLGNVEEGRKAHGLLLKSGLSSNNSVANSLIAFYFKIKRVESARKVFDELSDRDVITWNSMISGFASNNLGEKAISIFRDMVSSGIEPDVATIVNVLVACSGTKARAFGAAVHSRAIKQASFQSVISIQNTLLDMYAKCRDLESSIRVFESMGETSAVSWTSMISGFVREGRSDSAIELFRSMQNRTIEPDIHTLTTVLHACAHSGSLETGRELHNYIAENEMGSNLFVGNALAEMYAKCGSMKEAWSVFSEMKNRDVVTWNTMIGGFSKNGMANEALDLYSSMDSRPDGISAACALPACASLAALDKGREIHGHAVRNGSSEDQYVLNALVDMYVKCGRLRLAQKLFHRLPNKDLVSWTVMIAGYGMHGLGREAVAAFRDMRSSGIKPDEISFISILYACSHSGLIDEGWAFFSSMKNAFGIEPGLDHYACMVDLLSRAGKLSMAYKFIATMPIEPDAAIWGALLRGCGTHRRVSLAEKVAERVFELEPENTGYYVLLANIYAEAEKWEKVKKVRERIGERGLRKNPGCSWIEVKGKVNVFVAGDRSDGSLSALLKRVRARMSEEGHSPVMKFALRDASDVEKEAALCGHSEKLAMAFGVLNSPPGKVVRVTKNLRVCGDCHETAKFISSMFSREIVLRDSNRFHHFKNGSCSCRGFW